MTIKYYAESGSGSCRRTSAIIRYLGIEVENIFVDLLQGRNKTEAFLTLNPNGMVPVLVDEKGPADKRIILSEASAIMIYLCEKSGDKKLWPSSSERYEVLKWMFWAAEHFRQPGPMYFEENVLAGVMGNQPNQHRLASADQLLERYGPILDHHLAGRDFVVGDSITLADYDLAAPLSQMPRSGVPYDRFSNIMRWHDNLIECDEAWRHSGQALDERMNSALHIKNAE